MKNTFEKICDIQQTEKEFYIEKNTSIEIKDIRFINILNVPPSVPMNIEAPILENQIKEKGMHPKKKSNKIGA